MCCTIPIYPTSIRLPCLHMSGNFDVFYSKAHLLNCNWYRLWKPHGTSHYYGCTYHHHKGSCSWLHITTPSFKSPAHHTITAHLSHAMPATRLNRHGKAQRDCFTIREGGEGREGLAHASPREKDGGVCVCVCVCVRCHSAEQWRNYSFTFNTVSDLILGALATTRTASFRPTVRMRELEYDAT
jgi:hypothetical protein